MYTKVVYVHKMIKLFDDIIVKAILNANTIKLLCDLCNKSMTCGNSATIVTFLMCISHYFV